MSKSKSSSKELAPAQPTDAPEEDPEEKERRLQEEERLRQEELLKRLETSGSICAGIAGVNGQCHGEMLLLEADDCRRTYWVASGKREPSQYWFSGPSLASPRWSCSAACLGDGRILVVGGFDEFGLAVDTTEVVDIVTGEVSFGPRLTMPRAGCAAVALPLPIQEEEPEVEGEDEEQEEEVWMPWVMVIGGYGADAGQSTEVLSVQADTARPGPKLRSRRACCAAAMYGERHLIVAGGFDEFTSVNSTEILDLFQLKSVAYASDCRKEPTELRRTSWNSENEDEVISSPRDLARAWFEPGPSMMEWRAACTAVTVPKKDNHPQDRVWIIGGVNERSERLRTTEWLDVVQVERRVPRPRSQESEDKADEKPEVVEAAPPHGEESDANAPKPEEGEAEPTPKAGEEDENDDDADEAYSSTLPTKDMPADADDAETSIITEAFQPGPSLASARSGLAAVRLSDTVVLIAGGIGADGELLDTTEFYDFDGRKDEMQEGPLLSWGCNSQVGFSYFAASRAA